MNRLDLLREEVNKAPEGKTCRRNALLAAGYRAHPDAPNVVARAFAFQALLEGTPKHLYANDVVAGSTRGLLGGGCTPEQAKEDERLTASYGQRGFITNFDHFAPDYARFLKRGIPGILQDIGDSFARHSGAREREFLTAARLCMEGFAGFVQGYAQAAREQGRDDMADACRALTEAPPQTFRQALQLVWLCHTAFRLEGRYAMALGRMDQLLYPFYERDRQAGILTRAEALELTECTLYKIREARYFCADDVVNIAVGGVKRDGTDAVNELSYLFLDAVRECNIPGPNLSARLHRGAPGAFLDGCLQVIGTGLGYPALMNDEVNIPALIRQGYTPEDARDYCMVGCIENFIPGKQPPWSDGRYNTPKYLELALNNGVCMLTGVRRGPETGPAEGMHTMEDFMKALEEQMTYGAAEYMALFRNENERFNPLQYQQPFLSCFCRDCIGRALDINRGGALYPSVHGAGCMGIATVADSLAAVEDLVFRRKQFTLAGLRDMLKCDFQGFEAERQLLLHAPKYGNDSPAADKYAVWFVRFQERLFSSYRTRDGGAVYIAIASNVSNIPAGAEVAATPDGRHAREPLSDAASPMHGMDHSGPTAAMNSLTKPDYTLVSCGTVVNQKYDPSLFSDPERRKKLAALIATYFQKGGQELQINAVSRQVLLDAMEHPEGYEDLVVRVSGFSAYYTRLNRAVQEDILKRTEHNG